MHVASVLLQGWRWCAFHVRAARELLHLPCHSWWKWSTASHPYPTWWRTLHEQGFEKTGLGERVANIFVRLFGKSTLVRMGGWRDGWAEGWVGG